MNDKLPETCFLTPYGDQPRITKAEGTCIEFARVPGGFEYAGVLDWLKYIEMRSNDSQVVRFDGDTLWSLISPPSVVLCWFSC
jgi:hypothetical protein